MEELSDSGIEPYKKEFMRRLTVQQDAWFSQEISPYLKDAVSRFDGAAERAVEALQQTLIDQWRQSMWEVLCCVVRPSYTGSVNKQNAIDFCTTHLYGVVYAAVKNMSPYYPPQSGDGLLYKARDAALASALNWLTLVGGSVMTGYKIAGVKGALVGGLSGGSITVGSAALVSGLAGALGLVGWPVFVAGGIPGRQRYNQEGIRNA